MTDRRLDARGLICPLPVLKARKVLLGLAPGETLCVAATDENARKDFALFCSESGHSLVSIEDRDGFFEVTVRTSSAPSSE